MNQVNFLQSLGWSLINSLWQMALLWVVYQFITASFHKIRPAHKTSLATLLIFSGFAWFVYTLITSLVSQTNSITSFYNTGLISNDNWKYFASKILPYASLIYLIVLIAPVWQFIRNYRFVQMIRNTGIKKIDVAWRMYVKRTSVAMGISRDVKIWLSELVTSPVTIGYLKPIILIPVAAINNLTPHQIEAVILHELSHIYRYDYFINLILSFIKTVLYFNPFVSLLVKSVEKEREHSCDEMVLQFQYKPGEYASALLRLEQSKHRQMVLAAAGKNQDLLHRIESILGMRNKGWNPARQLSIAFLTMLGITLLNFFVSVNKQEPKQSFYTLSSELSPYYFLNGKKTVSNFIANASTAKNSLKKNTGVKNAEDIFNQENLISEESVAPQFMSVGYSVPEVPELAPDEECKVKEAVDATKKILQESEWKAMEKNYADAFSAAEKSQLKSEYNAEIADKVNWNNLEDKLRLSYSQINWEEVNQKLNTSLVQIKLDSIQQQINFSLKTLVNVEKAMKENNVTAIPDSDVTLQLVQENQQKAKDQLAIIKAAKVKKIVRL
ncbi:MAG TPA: M56 family metallopeptidase [Chitinophagaceae bacterium]|nr:M56 family metallopeptidase [Chitinophagaceae bacterium]